MCRPSEPGLTPVMMPFPAVAIVGMACRYPDANSPQELWENVLAQRRAFRQFPAERLNPADYWSDDRTAPDRTYASRAAVIDGYTFDRVRFRVSGSTYRAVDLAHWLALDVAASALADAGFPDGEGLPRASTGVLLGNTLTGEFSRANMMRLRWPYVRRVLDAALSDEGWEAEQRRDFLGRLETQYKAPFPPVGTETLAGGLSNTAAGRICNHFDLNGGGYTVDGACAASLLAVTGACTALTAGDLDVALAGGVDLSLDPFELVGFAKVGALADEQMRVYDARSGGFWPGEGCGFVVLMRYEEALRQGRRIYAVLRGWGVSSDGCGGITRPEVEGQLLAVRRAYQRAGFGLETVTLFEGHGTGTPVGDATELRMLSRARREADPGAEPAIIGSIKANIGHTKAAAGLAGLIKATLAVHHQVLPPITGCDTPHPELAGESPALRVLPEGQAWPSERPLRAGISAMGFGGINTHIVLEGATAERYGSVSPPTRALLASAQDAELFVLGAEDSEGLRRQVQHLQTFVEKLSLGQLADLAAHLATTLKAQTVRAALVAATPADLAERLQTLEAWLADGETIKYQSGVYLGQAGKTPRIGFLFPGQGSPARLDGGMLRRRFSAARTLYDATNFPKQGDGVATEVAQPAIVTASMATLRVLARLGVEASVAVGHSLGELTALHWAGGLDEGALLRLATARGRAMADLGAPTGAMAGLAAGPAAVEALIKDTPVVIAGLNGPEQTVISGEEAAVDVVVARGQAQGLQVRKLPVSHAFHSPLVAEAATPLADYLEVHGLQPLKRTVVSTVTGTALEPSDAVEALLVRQVTEPVRFTEAVTTAAREVDLWIEVGPGRVLSGLVGSFRDEPVVATNAGGQSLEGLLQAVGAAFAAGASLHARALFQGRFTRPFSLDWQPSFFVNPCEQAPASDPDTQTRLVEIDTASIFTNGHATNGTAAAAAAMPENQEPQSTIDLVRRLVADRAELPLTAVRDGDRLLSDLHLNSITVAELLAGAARQLGLAPSTVPTDYADATLAEVAYALEERSRIEGPAPVEEAAPLPSGVDTWIRPFTVSLVERPRPRVQNTEPPGAWQIFAPAQYPLKEALEDAFVQAGASGVVVALPPDPDAEHIRSLLEGAHAVMDEEGMSRFVLVQHGGGATAFARTLFLEAFGVTVCIVDVPVDHPEAVSWVLAEAQAASGYTEAWYDADGVRRESRLRLLDLDGQLRTLPLSPDDVLLVTGGGKGITAECAIALGQETGTALVLMGRSDPAQDAEVAATLGRLAEAGLRVHYARADITDAEAVQAALAEAEATLGAITGIVHGAARNVPQRLRGLDEATVLKTLAPKVQGLRNVLAAIDSEQLRLLVTFGSIIGRMGLPGEADYALANEWLVRETERWQRAHPACRCLAVEWSVWSSVGMGARMGSLDALAQHGIVPIPPDEGVSILLRLLAQPPDAGAVVVTGRYGEMPTLRFEQPEMPFLRFLEEPRLHAPGVEFIVDARLSADTDLYLDDHRLQGERVLPGVIGLEAMAQVAMALTGSTQPPFFEAVSFNRPVVVPADEASITLRIAALARTPSHVDVVLRSEQTAFQVDYFRATCRFEEPPQMAPVALEMNEATEVTLDPEQDLYGSVLFHEGRFRRLRGYRRLQAKACVAELSATPDPAWFGRYLPAELVLGDPGVRDATIHAIQACIPQATLVPIGIDRLVPGTIAAGGTCFVHARERERHADMFVYDVTVTDAEGAVVEHWDGLRLQLVGHRFDVASWAPPLLGPYLERRAQELVPEADLSVVVLHEDAAVRQARSDRALQQTLGAEVSIRRRPNGKPEAADGPHLAVAHAGMLTLAMAGAEPVGCDVEPVAARPEALWRDLLGAARYDLALLVVQETGEDLDAAATRLWVALESLKKAGASAKTPLVLEATHEDGWVVLASGTLAIATLVTQVQHTEARFGLGLLVGRRIALQGNDGSTHDEAPVMYAGRGAS